MTAPPPVVNPFSGVTQKVCIICTPENVANMALDDTMPPFADIRLHLDATYADGARSFEQHAQPDRAFIVNGRLSLADIEMAPGQMLSVSL